MPQTIYTAPKRLRAALTLAFLCALILAGVACGKREAPAGPAFEPSPAAAPMDLPVQAQARAPDAAAASPALGQRAMRITVESTLVVADFDASLKKLRAAVEGHGGYVSGARVHGGPGARSASLEARVPAGNLPSFRAAVAALGEVASDAEKAEDVTEQRADIGARLRNARAQEKRLLDLLSDKTGTLADVVAVEKELSQVRETVERIEAQAHLIEGQIAYATVTLSLTTQHEPPPRSAGSRIVRAAKDGIETAGAFLIGLAVLLVAAGPTLLVMTAIGLGLYYAFRGVVRRRRAAGRASHVEAIHAGRAAHVEALHAASPPAERSADFEQGP